MNGFTTRKIRTNPPRKPIHEKTKHHLITAVSILLVIAFIYYGGKTVVGYIGQLKIFNFFTGALGVELIADEDGHTNILLLGVGGEGHDGEDLTDTIIIGSLDHTTKRISLMSIPRDLHVDSTLGGHRVNRLYEQGKQKWGSVQGLDFARATFQEILDIPIHYAAKVDFAAFVDVVDSVGGIDVDVEEDITDAEYPKDGTYDYEPFFIRKGLQHLDGKTALKYVRSRKTSSDFDRSRRQHQALVALKEKATSRNLLGKSSFIKELFYSLYDHVETTLSIRELIGLAEFGKAWDSSKLTTAILNDEPRYRGGFLYTPLRELYGGAFVLLPAGDTFDSLHAFTKIVLYGPETISTSPLAILNGTKHTGLASKVTTILTRYGFEIDHVGNARVQTNDTTQWYANDTEALKLMPYLQKLFPGTVNSTIPPEYLADPDFANAKIILEIGEDALPLIEKLDIFRNVVQLTPTAPATPEASTTTPPETSTPAPLAQ